MRIRDAWSALQAFRGKNSSRKKEPAELSTIWSEQAQKGETLTDYPRPQLHRNEWINLNGYWHYAITRSGSRPEVFDGRILVPYAPECRRSGVNRRVEPEDYLWYFRSIELPELPNGKRLLLHFGAVDERCIVWMNGKLLGSHMGGYLPFSFDVTELVRTGKNTIWVRVQDATDMGIAARGKQKLHPGTMYYTPQSGIWQTVWMEIVPENFIQEIRITPLFDQQKVRLEISAAAPAAVSVTVSGEWSAYCHQVAAEEFKWTSREPSANRVLLKEATACVEIDLPEMRAWSPEDPFLYHLQLKQGEDQVSSYFAMRKFSAEKDLNGTARLFLNNSPCFMNGVLDQGYWPETLFTAPSDEAMQFDIQKMKDLGFNVIRKHIKTEPLRWYYHCDRLGMIVWQDMVNGGGSVSPVIFNYLPNVIPSFASRLKDNRYRLFGRSDAGGRGQWEAECQDTISHLYNCPCIGMWVLFNEGWGQFDSLRITDEIKKADSTRLVDHASGWFDQGGGDIKSVHNYFRKLRVKRDKRPFVISEYGGMALAVEGHVCRTNSFGYRKSDSRFGFNSYFLNTQRKLKALEKKGLAGAIFTQLSDVEEETNGLLTYDRKIIKIEDVGVE